MSSQTEDPPNRQDSQTLNPDRSTGNGVSAKQATTETGKGESPVGDAAPLARKVVTVNGERFFEFRVSVSTEEHLNNLRNMPMRQDDVIIAAYPKSGQYSYSVSVAVVVINDFVAVVVVAVVDVFVRRCRFCWYC